MEPSSEVEEKNQNLSNTRGLIASLFGIVAFSWLIYSNHLQITIDLFPSDVDRKEDNVIRWFDEHDLVLNFFDYIHCKRFDTFLSLVLAFFIFHWLVHSFVYYLWSFFLDRSTYYSLRVRDRYFITEKVLSNIHGLVSTLVPLKIIFIDQLFNDDVIQPFSDSVTFILAFSTAYELYDFFIMYLQTGADFVMYVHHITLLVSYFLTLMHKRYCFSVVCMLITEITVWPLNIHYILNLFNKKNNFFRLNLKLRFWLFVLVRLTVPFYVVYRLCLQWEEFSREPWFAKFSISILFPILIIMNVAWILKMVASSKVKRD